MAILPGVLVRVHVPEAGSPFRVIAPVDTVHDGWVILPVTGATGVAGCSFIMTPAEAVEIHPAAFVTVNV